METSAGGTTPQGPAGQAAQPPAPTGPAQTPAQVEAANYSVDLDVDRQEEYSRWLPLVKWFLLIPHYVALLVLGIGAWFALIGAFFVVLFTQRYPRGIFDYLVGVYRWGTRVTAYMYLMTDKYPAFALDPQPDDTARLDIAYPEGKVDWWRPLVAWLLALPYLFVAGILINLAGLVAFLAFFTILFTKQFPPGLFEFVLIPLRWQMRGSAYAYYLVTRYPPWVWA